MKYAKGVMWLDDCRIPFVGNDIPSGGYGSASIGYGNEYEYSGGACKSNQQGRFTPNLLVCDDVLNDGSVGKSNDHKWKGEDTSEIYGKYENRTRTQVYSDKGTNSRYYDLDKWFNQMIGKL